MIEIGAKDGMMTFDASVSELYAAKLITHEEAILNARDPSRIEGTKVRK
jgi:Tfp pilus assembly pilus retraction ATPase PilT